MNTDERWLKGISLSALIGGSRLPRQADLAPVPLHHNPAILLVIPAMRYPVGAWPRRLFPLSRAPGVSVAIPTLVSGNPDMVTAGGGGGGCGFNHRGGGVFQQHTTRARRQKR